MVFRRGWSNTFTTSLSHLCLNQNPTRGEFTLDFTSKKWSGKAGKKQTTYQLSTNDVSCFTVATDGAQIYGRSPQCIELAGHKP